MSRRNKPRKPTQSSVPAKVGGFIPPPGKTEIVEVNYSGPIPLPAMMAGFKDVLDNLPDRIMKMAEVQQQHEIEERTYINRAIGRSITRSMWFAFLLLFGLIAAGFYLILIGRNVTGGLIMAPGAILALIQILRVFPRAEKEKK